MPVPINQRKEILAHSSDKERMVALRHAIAQNFNSIWMFVHCDPIQNIYGVEVASVWGSKLPPERHQEIESFVNNWLKENKS